MRKKLWGFLIIIVVGALAIGFFYFGYGPLPSQIQKTIQKEQQLFTETNPPALFSKDDYKIEETGDRQYVVVEKAGLSCQIPKGWSAKVEGTEAPEPGYWITLLSPDAEMQTMLNKGCGITIAGAEAEQRAKEIEKTIQSAKENPKNSEICANILGISECNDYNFAVIELNGYQALQITTPEYEMLGQSIVVIIPLTEGKIIDFETRFLPDFKEKCTPLWEEFLNKVEISLPAP